MPLTKSKNIYIVFTGLLHLFVCNAVNYDHMETQDTQRNTNGVASDYKVFYLQVLGFFALFATILFAIDFVPELTLRAEVEPEITFEAGPASADTAAALAVSDDLATEHEEDDIESSSDEVPVVAGTVVYQTHSSIPTRIVAQGAGIDTQVLAPNDASVTTLDTALLEGAVYYPGSGALGQNANILIFGHSSHLPVVHNKAYKAFNELNELNVDDEVELYSETHKYVYSVKEVFLSDAGDTQVSFDASEPLLTLVTCNNFGAKEERWVVIATLVSKQAL